MAGESEIFLLTPLREGRLFAHHIQSDIVLISTHAPAGGATELRSWAAGRDLISTHAPAGGATRRGVFPEALRSISTHAPAGGATFLREPDSREPSNFYSRPCGRGDEYHLKNCTALIAISTHAPAGGATAIFHKSVMRFCGKLPKDDTVLCLASFGFPRRDPKAVYLAWISCANLPQKCVREGLALKDQGTSCFHEGLASHAFDPVLV